MKGDRVLAFSVKYALPLKRGDIVFFKTKITNIKVGREAAAPAYFTVKRVIGMPGEHLMIKQGKIYIDGQKITDFVKGKWDIPDHSRTYIPLDKYFLMGDNRSISEDSRDFGPVPLRDIFYKAHMIYWPIWRFKIWI